MPIQIVNENAVIAARSFNPSIFTQLWLIKNGILQEADFTEQTMFSPVAVDLRTSKFHLLLIPERLQLTFSRDAINKELILSQVALAIVNKLPHTPYVALGYNIRAVFTSKNNGDCASRTKELLLGANNPFSNLFSEQDARYGFYCSKDFLGVRLKLDLKPSFEVDQNGNKTEFLVFDFNCHQDLREENKVAQINSFLATWTEVEKYCMEIMQVFEKKWNSL